MNHLMEKLHGLEEKLGKVRSKQGSSLTIEILREALQSFQPDVLLKWLEEDREILKETLGDGFFEQENRIVIDSERLLELEAKVQEVLPPDECRILLPELRKLRYKSIKELLESYPEYTVALAERNEKTVALFEIEGGETMVDPLEYQDFVQSLGHVFRNAVVHGLESMEERLKLGKSETGRIRCRIEDEAAGMRMRISDDGRGMEPEKIGRLALHKGICTEAELDAMNEQQRLQLVFADGFSGAKQVNELAGRGVGLSAVLAEIKKLGGAVQIQSTPGIGTEFIFFLPFTAADHCAA